MPAQDRSESYKGFYLTTDTRAHRSPPLGERRFGDAVWFTLQTITVITAIITSVFMESARRRRVGADGDETAESLARVEAALDQIQARLERLER